MTGDTHGPDVRDHEIRKLSHGDNHGMLWTSVLYPLGAQAGLAPQETTPRQSVACSSALPGLWASKLLGKL